MTSHPVVLCILDGWGIAPDSAANGITSCAPSHWNRFLENYPYSHLIASENEVGLPLGQMGNSEVGHMTIGAGRIILQDLPQINHAFEHNLIPSLDTYKEFIEKTKAGTGVCHLVGLISPGGVHSHQDHIINLAHLLDKEGIKVKLHCLLDGRDTPPQSGLDFIQNFQHLLDGTSAQICTIGGRYYAMDRDQRWDRIAQAYEAIVQGNGLTSSNISATLESFYAQSVGDEFIPPHIITHYEGINPGDSLFMGNFRADRARQFLSALLLPSFSHFDRSSPPYFSATLGLSDYADYLCPYIPALFSKKNPTHTLGHIISQAGLNQLRLAETEKYAHVTFFFNGGTEDVLPGEVRHLIPSPSVATYDLQPEMSAFEITDFLEQQIKDQTFQLIVVNYANADMVGHTGNPPAIKRAIETIDVCLGRLETSCLAHGYTLIITADHGNAEQIIDENEGIHTAHTCNPVPFMVISSTFKSSLSPGSLKDIAPTILQIMDIPVPSAMTGRCLISNSVVVD